MKTKMKDRLPGLTGALIAIVIVATFAGGVDSVDTSAAWKALSAGASLGLAVVEFVALGFALGLLAFGARLVTARISAARQLSMRPAEDPARGAVVATIVSIPRLADATASEFDDASRPVFAPVTSLTEAQVERQRAQHRRGYAGTSDHSAKVR
ncbi:MAG TPA: hypothetical protein VLQ46_04995 [Casimicrobiaceae bacterium]|nr:hypothetical protein [Casimicrobiaceae bacterium]